MSYLEQYGLTLVIGPTSEPVTLAQAKTHCRVDTALTDDDAEIEGLLIPAAREAVEEYTGRALVTQTLRMTLDAFPADGEIRLPVAPVQSVSSISYVDEAGDTQTLDAADYQLDETSAPARIWPAYGECFPATREQLKAVSVTFVAGYGVASAVPKVLRYAVLMLVRAYYDGEADPGGMSDAVKRLLDQKWTGMCHGAA